MKGWKPISSGYRASGAAGRKIHRQKASEGRKGRFAMPEQSDPPPRKTSNRTTTRIRTKTDTGRRGEYPKALERTVLKELGNLTPYVRNKGFLQVRLSNIERMLRTQ